MSISLRLAACALLSAATPLHAQATLPALFADHMVLQRDLPVHVWGTAAANETVTVTFRGNSAHATADPLGRWSLYLPPGAAGGPFDLEARAGNRVTLHDILVGDLWVASGQSNMEMPLGGWSGNNPVTNSAQEIAAAHYPRIRLLDVDARSADSPQADIAIRHPWAACTPATAAVFSAVGYFFARDLQQHQDVPIGIISSSWGGTPASAWTSLDALAADASLSPVYVRRARLMNELATTQLQHDKDQADYDRARAAGQNPAEPRWEPDPNSWKPAGNYNAMIAPLTPLPIKGVLWYQGESDAEPDAWSIYGRLFQQLVQDWRAHWHQGNFPFLFVQLAGWNDNELFPQLRAQQRDALGLANTGMAVTSDIGDPVSVHPRNKQDVGLRLALIARALAYGEAIEFSGPEFAWLLPENDGLRLHFSHAHGLTARNGILRGFEIAGADGKFVTASARIDGETVLLHAPGLASPLRVRYAWKPNPDANLYNDASLPASPFQAGAWSPQQP